MCYITFREANYLLCEIKMCSSCKDVLKQVKKKYPNATINVISSKVEERKTLMDNRKVRKK